MSLSIATFLPLVIQVVVDEIQEVGGRVTQEIL
jgi:hypothetical protein